MTAIPTTNKNRALQSVGLHILVWVLLLVLPFLIFPKPNSILQQLGSLQFAFTFSFNTLLIVSFFYFNYFITVPYFYFKKRYLWFILSIILILGVFILFFYALIFFLFPELQEFKTSLLRWFIIRLVVVFTLSFGIKIYQQWKSAESEKASAELAYLKAQINPHFLFNTLNGIYTLAVKKSDLTADAIAKLSAIMRYVLSDAQAPKVALEKEISYINDVVALQKLRIHENTKVHFETSGQTNDLQIVPLLLIAFIENAFKYGVSTEYPSEISIRLTIEQQTLHLYTQNTIHPNQREPHLGIGLDNTKKRLDSFYKGLYHLKIDQSDKSFSVHLSIDLKK